MGKILLIDLDGTLTDTAHSEFKPFKDGLREAVIEEIPMIGGSREFIARAKAAGHSPVIVSDSHPKYVQKIADRLFQLPALSLADKPNPAKTLQFIRQKFNGSFSVADSVVVIGDSWLDIELGRSINAPTVLTNFYIPTSEDIRDGIGMSWKPLKSGPTYYANKFAELDDILSQPLQNLLSVEAIFQGANSSKAVKFKTYKRKEKFIAYRSLGRQNAGECDKYGVAEKYFEFQRADRSPNVLRKLAQAVENFIAFVQSSMPDAKWDYFTYVSDKATTKPRYKMKELFDLVNTSVTKSTLFEWKNDIKGNIRSQVDYEHRVDFVNGYLYINSSTNLKDKNVIVIDDQFTTGATAHSICKKLEDKGVRNILFVTLFYLITTVNSGKVCPKCGKKLQIKIRRSDGNKFYSCPKPEYGGDGCGYAQNYN